MARKLVALAGAAAALLLVAGTFNPADAQRAPGARGYSGGGSVGGRAIGGAPRAYGGAPRAFGGVPRAAGRVYGGAPGYSGRAFRGAPSIVGRSYGGYAGRHYGGRRHAGRFHGRHLLYGVPLAYGAYHYGYRSDSCGWLLHRAEATGEPYWWDRYNACLDGYDY